ncbi:MAG: DNA adenine methylase [Spirochaetales bacterium]|nr:DNA adenine methylase [Spirochaetales bacterium]MCF7937861.1 DNA adenine methylase [Spirochaetales bacterium]
MQPIFPTETGPAPVTGNNPPIGKEIPYLQDQLIAYIGNKRALLGFLAEVFRSLADSLSAENANGRIKFLDVFAGSGAVARLANYLGYQVAANDWEPYSYYLNSAYLTVRADELNGLFPDAGGFQAVLDRLNTDEGSYEAYLSRFYAPQNTADADYRTERLFYTRENAVFLDRARERIEQWYPGWSRLPADSRAAKSVLLSGLIYQAATHVNTSGVFKACHKGFGGHGQDALERIMRPMQLSRPILINGSPENRVTQEDAADFVSKRSGDICYLDPPYTVHQYGSNYHLLNTLALWDKPEVNQERGYDGRLKEKAGIRRDWKKTRSAYCYSSQAEDALNDLLRHIDARYIVLSYNSDGLIPYDRLLELLSRRGSVRVESRPYVTYRGGRRSNSVKASTFEFLMIVDTSRAFSPRQRSRAESLYYRHRLRVLLQSSFCPDKIIEQFPERAGNEGMEDGSLFVSSLGEKGRSLRLPMERWYRFKVVPQEIESLRLSEIQRLIDRLEICLCSGRIEEAGVLLEILQDPELEKAERERYAAELVKVLRYLAHQKYREDFLRLWEAAKRIFSNSLRPVSGKNRQALEAVMERARRRFSG